MNKKIEKELKDEKKIIKQRWKIKEKQFNKLKQELENIKTNLKYHENYIDEISSGINILSSLNVESDNEKNKLRELLQKKKKKKQDLLNDYILKNAILDTLEQELVLLKNRHHNFNRLLYYLEDE